MKPLNRLPSPIYVYGSVARGDVGESSDIDLILTQVLSSYLILQQIGKTDFQILEERIVMATPNHAIKGQIDLTGEITITFPLVDLKPRELEFYSFGGKIAYDELEEDKRVPGVDKSLLLIVPTEDGHQEMSILGIPQQMIQQYNLSQEIIDERKRVLQRRDKVGRTGVFLNEPVDPQLGFEGTLKQIIDRNSLVRNRVRRS